MSEKKATSEEYEFADREADVATLITVMNIAERMSTIPPHSPSQFGFSAFELRCIKLAIVDFGAELLARVKSEQPLVVNRDTVPHV